MDRGYQEISIRVDIYEVIRIIVIKRINKEKNGFLNSVNRFVLIRFVKKRIRGNKQYQE